MVGMAWTGKKIGGSSVWDHPCHGKVSGDELMLGLLASCNGVAEDEASSAGAKAMGRLFIELYCCRCPDDAKRPRDAGGACAPRSEVDWRSPEPSRKRRNWGGSGQDGQEVSTHRRPRQPGTVGTGASLRLFRS